MHRLDRLGDGLLNIFDQVSNFFSSAGGFLGEFTDFIGDNGEAFAMFTGAGGFDGSIEGEEVGLRGNIVDSFENSPNLLGALAHFLDFLSREPNLGFDTFHTFEVGIDGGGAITGYLGGIGRTLGAGLGVSGNLLDGGSNLGGDVRGFSHGHSLFLSALSHAIKGTRHLLHGGRCSGDGLGLLGSPMGDLLSDIGDLGGSQTGLVGYGPQLARGRINIRGPIRNLANQASEIDDHLSKCLPQ